MPQSVLVLDAHAMDHIPDEDRPDVDKATHAVSQEAIDAGVWVCGSGLEDQRASIVAADGTVTDGPPVTVGGLTVIEVPSREEAHKWAAKWAAACRCDQEIWELGFDPKIDAMLRQADNRKSRPDDA
ncbi:MAG TPA: YciI family protein [Jatrophihabitantaceae bacterium]|nr:YciI family protein [Jatrophihabitantaceae bacterium]